MRGYALLFMLLAGCGDNRTISISRADACREQADAWCDVVAPDATGCWSVYSYWCGSAGSVDADAQDACLVALGSMSSTRPPFGYSIPEECSMTWATPPPAFRAVAVRHVTLVLKAATAFAATPASAVFTQDHWTFLRDLAPVYYPLPVIDGSTVQGYTWQMLAGITGTKAIAQLIEQDDVTGQRTVVPSTADVATLTTAGTVATDTISKLAYTVRPGKHYLLRVMEEDGASGVDTFSDAQLQIDVPAVAEAAPTTHPAYRKS